MSSGNKKSCFNNRCGFTKLIPQTPFPVSQHTSGSKSAEYVDLGNDSELKSEPNSSLAFNDPAFADVVLSFHSFGSSDTNIYAITRVFLHCHILEQCKYFAAVLWERWRDSRQFSEGPNHQKRIHIDMTVPASRTIDAYLLVLQLLYAKYNKDNKILFKDVSKALSALPVAAEWLYDDCITACVQYLGAVPWTEEEEKKVMDIVPHLQLQGPQELLSRLKPKSVTAVKDMLSELVHAAIHFHPNGANVKIFVANLLKTHASRSVVKLVLDDTFTKGLSTLKDSAEEYLEPNINGQQCQIEDLQKVTLHTTLVNSKRLLWLLETMIELGVADDAVTEWSEQADLSANLLRIFNDDVWLTCVPSLQVLLLGCTFNLASEIAAGFITASYQVRKRLVECWLPVLAGFREPPSQTVSSAKLHSLRQRLEKVFLLIISTLPHEDAQILLPQCLGFASQTVEECSHLTEAFNLWFRRAGIKQEHAGILKEERL
ncbi:hypothetical protein KP509_17G062100 [Ceratopteris richardii]|uniref:At3g05675-like ankyrin-like domain-containing protein n=1 Tax=Ceratopteris richardii TaxID=49495 RepID=A0A8T2SYU5_CERRI|nr:hypothetical protein KP509_17G062100 [Ceratopteris richardii]